MRGPQFPDVPADACRVAAALGDEQYAVRPVRLGGKRGGLHATVGLCAGRREKDQRKRSANELHALEETGGCFWSHSVIASVLASTVTPPRIAVSFSRSPSQIAAIGKPKKVIR